jgi:pantothenate synthetase
VVVDPVTFERPTRLAGDLRLLIAADVGPVRLIDNLGVRA